MSRILHCHGNIFAVHQALWGNTQVCRNALSIRISFFPDCHINKQTPWPESASTLYRPSDHRLSAKLVPIFADKECHVVSVMGLYSHNLICYIGAATFSSKYLLNCTHKAEWTPIPDPLLLRKSGSAGNETRTSGSVAKNSDHWTTEAVLIVTYF
jgi:hypothetical protein